MARKRFISSILLCAFAVLFAHSITPHYHHKEETMKLQGSHHDDHDDHNDNFLGQAFSHFQHKAGGSITYETALSELPYAKTSFDKNVTLLVQYFIEVIYKPPVKHSKPHPVYFAASHYPVTSLLRGPPSAVA